MTFDWAGIVDREGAALEAAVASDPTAEVAAAPGWDTTELLRHAAFGWNWVSVVLRSGTMERPSRSSGAVQDPPTEGLLEWARSARADVVEQLRAIDDPDRPVFSFVAELQRVGFWQRRVPHETTVHRVDAEQAVGRPVGAIDPAFAVDGVDELLFVFVPFMTDDRSPGDGRTVHLHATDADGEWLVRFEPGGVVVDHGHTKGDAAVRGPAAHLYLWLWGRLPLEQLEVFGDEGAARALREITTV